MILVLIGTTMLPWKLHQKFRNSQNAPNFRKLLSNDEQHWKMWSLALEFPKYLLLPWKQCKNGQNGPKTPKSGIYFLKRVGQIH